MRPRVLERCAIAWLDLSEDVDQVRRREQKTLKAACDDLLAGTRYDWLRNRATMESADRRQFDVLRQGGLKTARAWVLKETAIALYHYIYGMFARRHFCWWWNWAQLSRLEPIKRVAGTLKRRFENVITYLRHRITNAGSELLNAKIQWVKYTARGFRNRQIFINAIYFHCGGLDMNPVPTKWLEASIILQFI
jgi:transposase